MKEEIVYLERILKIIDDLEKYVWQDDFEDFLVNDMKIDAIMMKLQLLWETVKKIWKYDNYTI